MERESDMNATRGRGGAKYRRQSDRETRRKEGLSYTAGTRTCKNDASGKTQLRDKAYEDDGVCAGEGAGRYPRPSNDKSAHHCYATTLWRRTVSVSIYMTMLVPRASVTSRACRNSEGMPIMNGTGACRYSISCHAHHSTSRTER